jgi:uncharacterized protein (DUF885 family)
MTPAQVHQLGLDEVQRVRDNMEAIATQAGYENKLQTTRAPRTDQQYEPVSGPACVRITVTLPDVSLPALFQAAHTLPGCPSIVETPAAHASTAPGAYYLAGSAYSTRPARQVLRQYVGTTDAAHENAQRH